MGKDWCPLPPLMECVSQTHSSPTSTSTRLSGTFPMLGPSQVSGTMFCYDADCNHQSCSWIYTGVQRSGH